MRQESLVVNPLQWSKLHHISEACMTSWGCGWMEIKVDEQAFVFGTTSVTYATQQHQHRQWSHWVVRSEPSLFGWYYTIYTLRRRSRLALHGRRLTDVLASHKDGNCLPFFLWDLHPSGDVVELESWTSVDSVFLILTHTVCFWGVGQFNCYSVLNGDDRQSNAVILSDCTQHWFEGSVSVLCYQSRSNILNDNFVERQER